MLFRTVYGPELEAIYQFVVKSNAQGAKPGRQDIYAAFVPRRSDGTFPPTQNVDDALAFLKSARMIEGDAGFQARKPAPNGTFAAQLLRAMRSIESGAEEPDHVIDPLYILLLTELFIKPDRLFVKNVHAEANRLRQVREAGGLSKEKIQTWKRVMEFLKVGRRALGGFLCAYAPELVLAIVNQWAEDRGTLQSFFVDHFDHVLPYSQTNGDLARSVAASLTCLVEQDQVELFTLQDSPTRAYFTSHYKGIARRRDDD